MSEPASKLDSLFLAASEIESAVERAAYLDLMCGDNGGLRKQVDELLNSDLHAGSVMNSPPAGLDARFPKEIVADKLTELPRAGLTSVDDGKAETVITSASPSVLVALSETIDLPRVVLRGVEDTSPTSLSNSPESHVRDADSRYQFQGEIARGGMGAVLKGRDTDLGRDLAIKVLLDSHKDNPDVIRRFVEEAQIGGQLQHPGIAPIYELGQFADKRPFFAMKLVKGETLSKLLADRADPSAERGKFIGIFEQLCQTMAYAHSRGVLHRDLKPANIMVGAFGEVQVMDWGLAKVLQVTGTANETASRSDEHDKSVIRTARNGVGSGLAEVADTDEAHTQMGSVMGTPAYMPPEQALGKTDQMDQRADVFGLGAILCQVLTGSPPYIGADGMSVYQQATRGELDGCMTRLSECGADEELVDLAMHCLEQDPKDRPRDAGVLAERVTGYLESVETKLREAEHARVDAQARAEELVRRRKLTYAIAALLLVGLVTAGLAASHFHTLEQDQRALAAANQRLADEREVERAAAVVARQEADAARDDAKAAEARALAEAKTATEVSGFLAGLFEDADPLGRHGRAFGFRQGSGANLTAREMIDRGAAELQNSLQNEPQVRATLLKQIADVYSSLGLPDQAEPLVRESLQIRQELLGEDHVDVAATRHSLAIIEFYRGQESEAEEHLKQALATFRKVYGNDSPLVASALLDLAIAREYSDRAESELLLAEALQIRRKHFGDKSPEVAAVLMGFAIQYIAHGNRLRLLPVAAELTGIMDHLTQSNDFSEIVRLMIQAVQTDPSNRQEAADTYRRCIEGAVKLLGKDHLLVAFVRVRLVTCLIDLKSFEEARLEVLKVVDSIKRARGSNTPSLLIAYHLLFQIETKCGQPDGADAALQESARIHQSILSRSVHRDSTHIQSLAFLAAFHLRSDELAEAELLMHEYFELAQKYSEWGSLRRACMKFAEAEQSRDNNPQAERILEAWLHAQLPFLSESNAHVRLDGHKSLAHLFVSQENYAALESNCRNQLKLRDEFRLPILKTLPGFAALAVLGQRPGGVDAYSRRRLTQFHWQDVEPSHDDRNVQFANLCCQAVITLNARTEILSEEDKRLADTLRGQVILVCGLDNHTLEADSGPDSNLAILAGLPLSHISGVTFSPANNRVAGIVAASPQLETINGVARKDWLARPQEIQALRRDLISLTPEVRLASVVEKLQEYNPGFGGELADQLIEDGNVVMVHVANRRKLVDLTPLQALPALRELKCPLTGVEDLSPLSGMSLTALDLRSTPVSDLAPLQGMLLTELECQKTRVSSLLPLSGMSLTRLNIAGTQISDLSPLKGMPLEMLACANVADHSPLSGMPLKFLKLRSRLYCDADEQLLQSLPLESIGGTMTEPIPAVRYWKRMKLRQESAARFRDETAGLSVTEQVKAVTQRLDEINPRIAHAKSFKHVVREGNVVEVTLGPFDEGFDLTPLLAFTKLEHLTLKSGHYLDLSSVKKMAIRHLICPESTVRLNAVGLSEVDGLETINGQPATDYLAGFQSLSK